MAPRDSTGLSELHALLGEGATFEGTLAFEGRVRIDGTFRGRIRSQGVLILGAQAQVEAQIEVGTLIVLGALVHGEIVAHRGVELHAASRVHADVCAPQLMVDRSAVFEGKSRRPTAAELEGEVDATEIRAASGGDRAVPVPTTACDG